ncbi:hypothetical protein FERRO_06240 [Ferrovum sp. JA12]|uniref:hypothetical protein n=1 Tax=Ferrovum sp. JA12 TaxID=1356299 RepID=UPI00070261CF|nr:hypothetical protein [Ferrovum sp. JA12]KRH79556.1 hypothetical protein FERRO_06240 [Ferrovum sp. JA12]
MLFDGLSISFKVFAESLKTTWMESVPYISCFKTDIVYSIYLSGKLANELPKKVIKQSFNESYLKPIATELNISLRKAAKLMALRNAWVANFQERELPKISFTQLRSQLNSEIAIDYVVLTSNNWVQHPWIEDQIEQEDSEDLLCVKPYTPEELATHNEFSKMEFERKIQNIEFCTNLFRSQNGSYKSMLEADADAAKHDVKRAEKRILELQDELAGQENIIRAAKKVIRKFRDTDRLLNNRLPGRQEKTEEELKRIEIAKRFVSQWVISLKNVLEVNNCSELANAIGSQRMILGRWENKKALPTISSLRTISNNKIQFGKYAGTGTKLYEVQTTPSLSNLVNLIEFV